LWSPALTHQIFTLYKRDVRPYYGMHTTNYAKWRKKKCYLLDGNKNSMALDTTGNGDAKNLNIKLTRDHLQDLDYRALFNELGWDRPQNTKRVDVSLPHFSYQRTEIAQLSGVAILEIEMPDGKIPVEGTRKAIHTDVSLLHQENLLIFVDRERTQSFWYWVKREDNKSYPRTHLYVKGQPGDLSLSKLESMVFDAGEFDVEGKVPVLDVARKLQDALDVERVTKRFYEEFKDEHARFLDTIKGIDDERDRRWYASVLLNRLMFVYFLQRKKFIDNGDLRYLQNKLADSQRRGKDIYYSEFLHLLFFEGFAKPKGERSKEAKSRLGTIRYLNGGLFLPHPIEKRWPDISIPDSAFERILTLFQHYSWNLDDTPGGLDNEISPHVLGYIFEKYINQKSFGAYYTRPEITEYLCERAIHKLILERVNTDGIPGITRSRHFDTVEELLTRLDAPLCGALLEILPKISLLDPACGSGAFLVSAMNVLTNIYGAVTGKIEYLNDVNLTKWLRDAKTKHDSLNYYIKKKIITENLFGVDIMEEGTEIAKLRLFLALVSSVQSVEQLEPLPNIDFNILPGNSLIGLLHINEDIYNTRIAQLNLFQKRYIEIVAEKNLLIQNYKDAPQYTEDLSDLRDIIQKKREEAIENLNELLLDEFNELGAKYEAATWDAEKQAEGKPKKRALRISDIAKLHPFHWGYEFDKVMNERGGFDIIITNPPWEILKPQAKEFFATHSKLVSKNKMRIEDFETERTKLLEVPEIRHAWLDYQDTFPYQSAYFRAAPQYRNQISLVNGKKAGTDINLYKLFTEQCYNLLRDGGQCGIVIPSGIYTDLGAKQLREMLFDSTEVTGIFGFENNKLIFEGVHRSFKFVVLTFEKGGQTQTFPSAFMRHEVAELERFPRYGALHTSVELIHKLSPDSLSIMEFKDETDVIIAQKMLKFPLLGEKIEGTWNLVLGNEFHMTNDSHLFKITKDSNTMPLYEGKMVHQFTHVFSNPRYWIDSTSGRDLLIRQEIRRVESALYALAISQDDSVTFASREACLFMFLQSLGYNPVSPQDVCIAPDAFRIACRDIARNTDERTLITTILPANVFAGNTLNYVYPWNFKAQKIFGNPSSIKDCYERTLHPQTLAYFCGVLNSFALDYLLRFKVTAHANMFYLYQLPVPRLAVDDPRCFAIASRVAQLVCVGSEFNQLRLELLGSVDAHVAVDDTERRKLRSEIDGLVTHLYGLDRKEFDHILKTFPLVKQEIKSAALDAYDLFTLEPESLALMQLIEKGEIGTTEFKVAACWNAVTSKKDDSMRNNLLYGVAAFLNSYTGGTLLIGVDNAGNVIGLDEDYKTANAQKPNRDGYQLFLQDLLKDNLIGIWTQFYTISFGVAQGKDVCRIDIQPSNEPVFLKNGDFYIREGNRKRKLNTYEAGLYQRQRWK